MVVRIRLEGKEVIARSLNAKPAQIKRAGRKTVRDTTNKLHKDLGGAIPRAASTPVGGYRRVRARKRRAKVVEGGIRGSVWMGTRKIAAAYVGRLRNDPDRGGAWAGKYFFENSFVGKMRSGHESVFERVKGKASTGRGKIKERHVHLPQAREIAKRAAFNARKDLSTRFTKNLKDELTKKQ